MFFPLKIGCKTLSIEVSNAKYQTKAKLMPFSPESTDTIQYRVRAESF